MTRALPIAALALLLAWPAGAATRAHRQQHAMAAAFYQCLAMHRGACR